MAIRELQQERRRLENTLKYHLAELQASDNPPGILLCHRNGAHYRWLHKYLNNGSLTTRRIKKSEYQFAEKLAVNLYRLVNIKYLHEQLRSVDQLLQGPFIKPKANLNETFMNRQPPPQPTSPKSKLSNTTKNQNSPESPIDILHRLYYSTIVLSN